VANSTHTVLNSHLKVLKIPSWFDSKSFAHLVSECPPTENRMSKEDRGFASMDREQQREIASKCGFRKFWPLDSGNSGAFPRDAGGLS
jgi:hypothetical protein